MAESLIPNVNAHASVVDGDLTTTTRRAPSLIRRIVLGTGILILILGAGPAWRSLWFTYHLSAGSHALAARQYSAAVEHSQKACGWHANDPAAAFQLAVAYRRAGAIDRVETQLAAAQNLGWPERDVQLQRLLVRAQIGRFRDVEPQLRRYFDEGLDDQSAYEVYEALAQGYWADHDFNEAIRCLDYWIEWRPTDIEPRLMKADIFNSNNDPVAAEEEYREVLDLAPQRVEARAALGKLLIKRAQVEEAEKHLRQCQSQGYDTVPLLIALAECDYRSGRIEEAGRRLADVDYHTLEPEMQAEALKLMADIARYGRDHERAVQLLEEALRVWQHNSSVHEALGQSYAAVGKPELAKEHLELCREINERGQRFHDLQREVTKRPQDPEVRFQIGNVLREQGFPTESAGWWRSALRCDRYHQGSHEALARYHTDRGDLELAAQHKRSAQLAVEVTFRRAWAALQANDQAAAASGADLLEPYPEKSSQVDLLRAGLLVKEKKFSEARARLTPSLADPVLRPFASSLQAEALIGEGKLLEAEPLLTEAVGGNPADVTAVRLLAVLYYDLGAVEQANFYLKRVAELDPADYRPQRLLGLMYKDYEKYSDAVEHYRQSLLRNPPPAPREEVLLELAECLIKLRDHSAAIDDALQKAQPSASRQVMLAECLFQLGQRQEAVALTQEVLEQESDYLAALVLMSDVAMLDRDYAQAVQLLRRATTAHPFDYVAHHKLSQALTHVEGSEAEAQSFTLRAAELKLAWERFSELNKEAMRKPYDAAVRRDMAKQAESLGRADLAEVWRKAAEAIERAQSEKVESD